jgi:hypothetical protein
MKLLLKPSPSELTELEALSIFIPSKRLGKPLNLAQCEGQFQIDQTIWGLYFNDDGNYFIQYEEGSLEPLDFTKLLCDLVENIEENLNCKVFIDGILHSASSYGSYLA